MAKIRLTGATFDASEKTVTHASFSDVTLAGIQLITNVTDQIIIYNFADTAKGGTLSTDTLTLEYDTTTMSDTDELMILVEDGSATLPVSGTVTANLSATDNAVLDAIEADTTTIAGAVAGTEMQVDVLTMPAIDTELTTADLDTGAGTDTRAVVGLVGSKSGGGELIPGSATDGLLVNLGANNDVSVTGTVAVTQSGTWDEVGINDSGNNISIDWAGTVPPIGAGTEAAALRVTLATDSTGVVSIDDNGGVLTVDGTVAVTNAGITTIAGAVSGTEMQVDVVAALPAGTNAIGKLAANSGVDIGDVDITSIAAGDNNIGNVDVVTLPALAAGTNAIGKLVVQDTDTNGNTNHAQKYYTNAGAVTDGIIWSPAAGKRWHILTLYINVSAAATVTLEDDLAGGDSAVWKGELAANSGVVLTYDKDHAFASTEDAADLIITTSAGNVYVQAVGYEI